MSKPVKFIFFPTKSSINDSELQGHPSKMILEKSLDSVFRHLRSLIGHKR